MAELECSLSRGQIEIKTHWHAHATRLGRRFEEGDDLSREQMKDIVINLQSMLLGHLRASVEGNTSLDMRSLLWASNNGSSQTILVLSGLRERIAQSGPSSSYIPVVESSVDPFPGLAHYTQSYETRDPPQHPASNSWTIPLGSSSMPSAPTFRHDQISISPKNTRSVGFASEPSSPPQSHDRKSPGLGTAMSSWWNNRSRHGSHQSTEHPIRSNTEPLGHINPSRLFVIPDKTPEEQKATSPPRKKKRRVRSKKEAMGDDFSIFLDTERIAWAEEQQSDSRIEVETETESSNDDTISPTDDRPQSRPPRIAPRTDSPTRLQEPPSLPHMLPTPPSRSPLPPASITSHASHGSTSTHSTSTAVSHSLLDTSYWPPRKENHFSGFCKGAWKLSSGYGSFTLSRQPYGIYSQRLQLICRSCRFSMPPASLSAKNKDAAIDHSVHTHPETGIKYRWLFLAKSHIPKDDALSIESGFACIFCCVELDASAPVLFCINDFMKHLLSHRELDHLGLLGFAKCIVGKVAEDDEVFEINIPPEPPRS